MDTDVLGKTAENPVDLTMEDSSVDEPTSITQSLPLPKMGNESVLGIDIEEDLQLYRPAILSVLSRALNHSIFLL